MRKAWLKELTAGHYGAGIVLAATLAECVVQSILHHVGGYYAELARVAIQQTWRAAEGVELSASYRATCLGALRDWRAVCEAKQGGELVQAAQIGRAALIVRHALASATSDVPASREEVLRVLEVAMMVAASSDTTSAMEDWLSKALAKVAASKCAPMRSEFAKLGIPPLFKDGALDDGHPANTVAAVLVHERTALDDAIAAIIQNPSRSVAAICRNFGVNKDTFQNEMRRRNLSLAEMRRKFKNVPMRRKNPNGTGPAKTP